MSPLAGVTLTRGEEVVVVVLVGILVFLLPPRPLATIIITIIIITIVAQSTETEVAQGQESSRSIEREIHQGTLRRLALGRSREDSSHRGKRYGMRPDEISGIYVMASGQYSRNVVLAECKVQESYYISPFFRKQ
jgi:hypothetical protein